MQVKPDIVYVLRDEPKARDLITAGSFVAVSAIRLGDLVRCAYCGRWRTSDLADCPGCGSTEVEADGRSHD